MFFTFLLICCVVIVHAVEQQGNQLVVGYPTRVQLHDDGELCLMQFEVPPFTGKIEILVDIELPSSITGGLRSAIVYASPGPTVSKNAVFRFHATEFGDVRVLIPRPQSGLWTIGLSGLCSDLACANLLVIDNNNYWARVSVFTFDAENRLHLQLENGLRSGYVTLKERDWAYFHFRLSQPSKINFAWVNVIAGQFFDGFQVVMRRVSTTDLAGGSGGLPTTLDESFNGRIENVQLDAGLYVIGVHVLNAKLSDATSFFADFSVDQPFPSSSALYYPRKMPDTYCPRVIGDAEVGIFDRCQHLDCETCITDSNCIYCEGPQVSGCSSDSTCPSKFGLGIIPISNPATCNRCKELACHECTNTPGCSFCDSVLYEVRFAGCAEGTCLNLADDLSGKCDDQDAGFTLGTFPDGGTQPGVTFARAAAGAPFTLAASLAVLFGALQM